MKSVLRQKNVWNVFNLFILLKEILSFDDLHYFEFWMPSTYQCFIKFVKISGMFHSLMPPYYYRSFISFNQKFKIIRFLTNARTTIGGQIQLRIRAWTDEATFCIFAFVWTSAIVFGTLVHISKNKKTLIQIIWLSRVMLLFCADKKIKTRLSKWISHNKKKPTEYNLLES